MWSVNDEHQKFTGNLSQWILNKISALYNADFIQKPYTAGLWQVSSAPLLTDHMDIPAHSMARANLNKRENVVINTTAASKYKSRRLRFT